MFMVFGLGPVVRYELITTARRGRFYIARVVYGLCLLFLLFTRFQEFNSRHPQGGTVEEVQTFAEATFISFAGAQGAALLCLIPALVAGVIADEHQRKTLHYLLASRLSSAEIVLGKLGARLVHVTTFVALGIPVVCLLALYGGLNPDNVFYVYLGTLSIAVFASGLSILISIMARRPRDAILVTYGIGALWLLVPAWLQPTAHYLSGSLWWVGPVNDWVLMTNPLFVWGQATNQIFFLTRGGLRAGWFLGQFTWIFYWMVGLQSALGLLFVALAVLGLRPMRGNSWPGGQPQTGWWSRLVNRFLAITRARVATSLTQNQLLIAPPDRAPCGDDPMFWKERHTSAGGGLRWLGSRPMVLFFGVLLGCYLLDVSYPVLSDWLDGRWRQAPSAEVSDALRGSSEVLAVLAMLGVAAAAAVSLTGEREQDTWTSLATTLLTPAEIVRAKQFGAVWSARRVGVALLVTWAAGVLLGGIHPLGVLACALYVVVIAWLIATIGVFASSIARNSTRALVATFIAILVFSAVTQWPATVWLLLFSYQNFALFVGQSARAVSGAEEVLSLALRLSQFLFLYALIGAALTLGSTRRLRATWGR
jgi:ABC-type transport system involved in multi-copper enzyme maturation permease subunit